MPPILLHSRSEEWSNMWVWREPSRQPYVLTLTFLATRVKQPDEDDWRKLCRVIWYLNGTRRLTLKLTIDDLAIIKWWIDGSHNVHPDCRGHTGAMMSLGKGAVASYSRKHKLNTKSSTESEIVSVDQVMPEVCWTYNFLEAQGYSIDYSEIFQDNISAQLLEINGKLSSTKRTKHIKAKFFFVKDKVDKGQLKITNCPTEVM